MATTTAAPLTAPTRAQSLAWSTWLPWLFAGLAFGQTLAFYAYLANDPGGYNGTGAFGDQVSYITLGQQLLHGDWSSSSHYMPGLPALLAGAQLVFGDPRLGIAVLQGLVFAALVIGAARLAARACGRPASLWTAGLLAFNPTLGYYASQALTEFLTGVLLFLAAVWLYRWSNSGRLAQVIWGGTAVGLTGYLRSEYLALALVFGVPVAILAHQGSNWLRALRPAVLLVVAAGVVMLPWIARYWIVTGHPAIYDESPMTDLVLKGTFFRSFDEATFTQLQVIERQPGPTADAVQAASHVGPNPELSARYVAQVRGPYVLPPDQTVQIAVGNIALQPRQFLVNHFVEAPFLIWAGHTPLRQSDANRLPTLLRWSFWGLQLALLLVALWQAIASLRTHQTRALALTFLAVFAFLTALHILIAVDDRFTVPALPLSLLFSAAWLGNTLPGWWRDRPVLSRVQARP